MATTVMDEEGIVMDILLRLPVKSLCRFKVVNKQWYSLISDAKFGRAQLKRSLLLLKKKKLPNIIEDHNLIGSSTQRLLSSGGGRPLRVADRVETRQKCISWTEVPGRQRDVLVGQQFMVVGSCHGLVVLVVKGKGLAVCNPTTGEYRDVPAPPSGLDESPDYFYGLGYDSGTEDYKLLQCYPLLNTICVEMFSLIRSSSWRNIDIVYEEEMMMMMSLPKKDRDGIYVDGCLYWLIAMNKDDRSVMLSFDLETEKFSTHKLPKLVEDYGGGRFHGLGFVGEQLFVYGQTRDDYIVAYVMTQIEDGSKKKMIWKSWCKVLNYLVPANLRECNWWRAFSPDDGEKIIIFHLAPHPDILRFFLIHNTHNLKGALPGVFYGFNDDEKSSLTRWNVQSYFQTLISPHPPPPPPPPHPPHY